jgi:hypothetical protein
LFASFFGTLQNECETAAAESFSFSSSDDDSYETFSVKETHFSRDRKFPREESTGGEGTCGFNLGMKKFVSMRVIDTNHKPRTGSTTRTWRQKKHD